MISHRLSVLLTFLGLITLFLSGYTANVEANTKQQKESELKELQLKIKQLQKNIAAKQNSKSQYVKQLRTIEKSIGSLNKKIKNSEAQIKTSKKRLKNLNSQKKQLNKSLTKNKARLKKQIYGAYVQGQSSQLQMIFNQQQPSELQRQLVFYQYIAQQQSHIIQSVNSDIKQLETTQQEITQETAALKKSKAQFIKEQKTLAQDRTKRRSIIKNIDAQLKKQGTYLSSLNEDAEQLKNLISSINEIFKDNTPPEKPFPSLKGQLPWPLEGELKAMYGRLKPLSNLKWQGHVIYAPLGNHVRAIASGRVAYADWLKGFGNIIIIDHGNNYLSLYSHNQSLYKAAGEPVKKGEIISSSGNSGGNKKSGIYFEIRKKGSPQNPSLWCNHKNKFNS